jgi:hypothetical protein
LRRRGFRFAKFVAAAIAATQGIACQHAGGDSGGLVFQRKRQMGARSVRRMSCGRRASGLRKSPLGPPRGRPGTYLFTVRGDTRIPIFNSNSLAIRRISACNSGGMGGRPGRDYSRQNSFHPARCQRISVSGCTTANASRQSNIRDSRVRPIRVAGSIRRGLTPRSI